MQKKLSVIFIFLLMILLVERASAEEIKCEYPDVGLTMTWDTEKSFNSNSGNSANPFVELAGFDSSDDYERTLFWRSGKKVQLTDEANIDQKLFKSVLDTYGCNDRFRMCIYTEIGFLELAALATQGLDALFSWDFDEIDLGGHKETLIIMTEEEYKNSSYHYYEGGSDVWDHIYVLNSDKIEQNFKEADGFLETVGATFESIWDLVDSGLGFEDDSYTYSYKETICEIVNYDGPYKGVNINCGVLQNKMLKFVKTMRQYKETPENSYERADLTLEVRKVEDEIKSLCRSIFENYDYDAGSDNPGAQAECIDACMNMKETLNEYKIGTDLADEDNSGECGFSARLLVWISNALRWIKYILPVFVIVLSILDFIKAIGADKEDEMKKAQKKFITRLIAAGLVFIVPLIIEFVLDKMGFGYNDCGLF